MALTANRELNRYVDQELRSYPVAAAEHIYKGVFVGVERSTGYVRNLTAGDLFAGIAYEEIDNTAGAAGELSARVYTQGDFVLPVRGVAQALVGGPVFASDNEQTVSSPVPGASYVGVLVTMISAGSGIVRLGPMGTWQTEHSLQTSLSSSTSGATPHAVLIPERAILVTSAQVSFSTVPHQGNLDIGTTVSAPDEMVEAFNLAGLSANSPATLSLIARTFAAGSPLYAKVGQASASAGDGGVLSLRYVELP